MNTSIGLYINHSVFTCCVLDAQGSVQSISWNRENDDEREKAKQFFDQLPRRVKNKSHVAIPKEQVIKKSMRLEASMTEDFLAIDLQYNPTKYFPNIPEPLAIDFEINGEECILYATRLTLLNDLLNELRGFSLDVISIEPEEVSVNRYLQSAQSSELSTIDSYALTAATGAAMRELR